MAPASSPTAAAEAWLGSFAEALASGDSQTVLALFGPECFWRDLVAFTWNLSTEEGPAAIAAMAASTGSKVWSTGIIGETVGRGMRRAQPIVGRPRGVLERPQLTWGWSGCGKRR